MYLTFRNLAHIAELQTMLMSFSWNQWLSVICILQFSDESSYILYRKFFENYYFQYWGLSPVIISLKGISICGTGLLLPMQKETSLLSAAWGGGELSRGPNKKALREKQKPITGARNWQHIFTQKLQVQLKQFASKIQVTQYNLQQYPAQV